MDNTKWAALEELCTFENGDRGASYPSKSDFSTKGIPFLNAGNIEHNVLADHGFECITEAKYKSLRAGRVRQGDILFCLRGTIGKCAISHLDRAAIASSLVIIRCKSEVNTRYIYYMLTSEYFQRCLANSDNGSVQGNISVDYLKSMRIPVPALVKQEHIAATLGAIDDKIANNKKLMMELESTARLIYDYWFTQFDFPDENGRPYRSSGGKMVWSNELKCEIPNGWKVVNLYGIADYINGLACQNHRPKGADKGLPVIKIREMHDGITEGTERVSSQIPARNIIEDGDMLFAWSASLEVQYWNGGTAGLNQHIFKVIPKVGIPSEYVYQQLVQYLVIFKRMAEVRKTTMGHITSDHLDQSRIVLPPQDVLQMFDDATRDVRKSIVQLEQQIRELILLRDWLLPMLMNGQITIEG